MTQAIFLSYASQDADAAKRVCDALRAAGLEVWFDQSELRGGDAWDASIRRNIKECALFVPMISANTNARSEGYFRLEWKLAVDRSHLMADDAAFFMPVILDDTKDSAARVPEAFRTRQWTRVNDQAAVDGFAVRVAKVVAGCGAGVAPDPSGESAAINASNGEVGAFHKGVVPSKAAAPVRTGSKEVAGPNARSRRTLWMIAAVLALLCAAAFIGYRSLNAAKTRAIDSVAVLPFHVSATAADADTDYLSVGLAETLIYQLSRMPSLKVSPASSVYRFKGKEIDAHRAGSELGVAAVMTGRLVQRGENLSISVELVDVRNQKSLWGERYDRKMADLLATQRDISAEIARNLQVQLSGEAASALTKRYTNNNDAYQAFLKGRYLYMKRGQENLKRSVEHYREAVRLDPQFALAYVGIADSYTFLGFFENFADAVEQARIAVQKALEINPNLAEAHGAQASLASMVWDWESAERSYKRALALDDGIGGVHYFYAMNYLLPNGRVQEGTHHIDRALALEPMSIPYAANLARAYLYAGQHEKALTQARKVFALEPGHPAVQGNLMNILIVGGRYDEAIRLMEGISPESRGTSAQESLALAYAAAGRAAEARSAWDTKVHSSRSRRVATAALVQEALGDREGAFAALDAAVSDMDYELVYVNIDPRYASLKSDPRFAGLIKRIGLKP